MFFCQNFVIQIKNRNDFGQTPLHFSIELGHIEISNFFFVIKENRVKNIFRNTFKIIFYNFFRNTIINSIKGGEVNVRDNDFWTPLI